MKTQLLVDGKVRTVVLEPRERAGEFSGQVDGEPVSLSAVMVTPGVLSLVMESGPLAGRAFRCVLAQEPGGDKAVVVNGRSFGFQVHDPRSLSTRKQRVGAEEGTLLLKASMAGRVVRVMVEAGGAVEAGGSVLVIEAMKMQNEIRSSRAGTVAEVKVQAGEMVTAGQVLAVVT